MIQEVIDWLGSLSRARAIYAADDLETLADALHSRSGEVAGAFDRVDTDTFEDATEDYEHGRDLCIDALNSLKAAFETKSLQSGAARYGIFREVLSKFVDGGADDTRPDLGSRLTPVFAAYRADVEQRTREWLDKPVNKSASKIKKGSTDFVS